MRTSLRFLFFLTLLSLPLSAHAQLEVSTSVFYGSPYVWRGEVLSTGFVFQPTVTASYEGLSLTFFGNVDPSSGYVGDKWHVQEADLTAAYGATLGGVAIGAGYTLYTFPLPGDGELELQPTHEVFGSIGLASVPLAPSVMVAYDFKTFDGVYAEARLAQEVMVAAHPYALGVALGLDSAYLLPDSETELSHLALTAGTSFSAGALSFSPMLGFQVSLSELYRDTFGDTFFYGGFAIGF